MSPNYIQIATETEVSAVITRLATTIVAEHPSSPLFVSLLRGAAPFSSQLMHSIVDVSPEYHPELDYMMVATYGDEKTAGQPRIVTDITPSTIIKNRTVIIIDDVLDKGITARFVSLHLKNLGALEIKLAVLCDKKTTRLEDIKADYAGFTVEDAWIIGMGMDNASEAKEAYRWTRDIWRGN